MIAFYYGITGYASAIYYRKVMFRSVKNFVGMCVLPVTGGVILTWAFVAVGHRSRRSSELQFVHRSQRCVDVRQLFGIGVPLALSIGFLILGVVLMVIWMVRSPEFFRQRPGAFQEGRDTGSRPGG